MANPEHVKESWADLESVADRLRHALKDFAKGNPQPTKEFFSRRDDVTLANPFGPAVQGWDYVSKALEFAASRFRDGDVSRIDTIASYVSADLATFHETEHWQARVGEGENVASFTLRVTSTFRREEGKWRLVHRHADPIASHDPNGPMRSSLA